MHWKIKKLLPLCIAGALSISLSACSLGSITGQSDGTAAQTTSESTVSDSTETAGTDTSVSGTSTGDSAGGSVSDSSSDSGNSLVAEAVSADSSGDGGYIVAGNGSVNVREEPSEDASVYTSLSAGTEVDVIGEQDGWYTISLDGGTYYIKSGLLEQSGGSSSAEDSDSESADDTYVTVTRCNVREEPSEDASIYTSLDEGEEVEVIDEEDGWYTVSLDGGTYYMKSSLLKKNSD